MVIFNHQSVEPAHVRKPIVSIGKPNLEKPKVRMLDGWPLYRMVILINEGALFRDNLIKRHIITDAERIYDLVASVNVV